MQSIEISMTADEWQKLGGVVDSASLNTLVSLAESDVMEYLDERGQVLMETLIEDLPYPPLVAVMSSGALVRDGLVRVTKFGDSVLLSRAGA